MWLVEETTIHSNQESLHLVFFFTMWLVEETTIHSNQESLPMLLKPSLRLCFLEL